MQTNDYVEEGSIIPLIKNYMQTRNHVEEGMQLQEIEENNLMIMHI